MDDPVGEKRPRLQQGAYAAGNSADGSGPSQRTEQSTQGIMTIISHLIGCDSILVQDGVNILSIMAISK